MNHMHTIFATTTSSSPALVLSQGDVYDIVIFLVSVALVIVVLPLLLSLFFQTTSKPSPDVKSPSPSFFETPYITWFLVHYGISALAVIAILILGLDGVIDKGTVSALLGSLFGYVLGSTAKGWLALNSILLALVRQRGVTPSLLRGLIRADRKAVRLGSELLMLTLKLRGLLIDTSWKIS